MTTVLVRISSDSARISPTVFGASWTWYSSFCDAYFASLPSFCDDREVHHLVERTGGFSIEPIRR